MTDVRGTWNLHEAIETHWNESGLAQRFQDEWSDADNTTHKSLWDGDVTGRPFGPYCAYEFGTPSLVHRDSGTSRTTDNETWDVPLQLRVHAQDKDGISAKTRAINLAKNVAEKFDKWTPRLRDTSDRHVTTFRNPDFGTPEGEREYVWTLQYLIRIDSEYVTNP